MMCNIQVYQLKAGPDLDKSSIALLTNYQLNNQIISVYQYFNNMALLDSTTPSDVDIVSVKV